MRTPTRRFAAFAVLLLSTLAEAQAPKQLVYETVVIGDQAYYDVHLGQAMHDPGSPPPNNARFATLVEIDGHWLSVGTRWHHLPFRGMAVPVNPDLQSTLKIVQIFYKASSQKRLGSFNGTNFNVCIQSGGGEAEDDVKFPRNDDPKAAADQKIDKNYVGFAMDKKAAGADECQVAVWKVRLKAEKSLQDDDSLKSLMTRAGNRLAIDLRDASNIPFDEQLRNAIPRRKGEAEDILTPLFEPFQEASREALVALGIDAREKPQGKGAWKTFLIRVGQKIADWAQRRSADPQVPVVDPVVFNAISRVYVTGNFLFAKLEPMRRHPEVAGAIAHLQKFSDEIARSLGFRKDGPSALRGPGVSRTYYSIMDNAAWAFTQMLDRLYLGLTDDEKTLVEQMREAAEVIRKAANSDGDVAAADMVRKEFHRGWHIDQFQTALTKLFRNRTPFAGDVQQVILALKKALDEKTSRQEEKFKVDG
ncbi:MAG TPA: hypothetical protein VM598_01810 [Bdellovibrionota bacterium]|nr:hypothetical protein [Bdellovibrionota bacterium]